MVVRPHNQQRNLTALKLEEQKEVIRKTNPQHKFKNKGRIQLLEIRCDDHHNQKF